MCFSDWEEVCLVTHTSPGGMIWAWRWSDSLYMSTTTSWQVKQWSRWNKKSGSSGDFKFFFFSNLLKSKMKRNHLVHFRFVLMSTKLSKVNIFELIYFIIANTCISCYITYIFTAKNQNERIQEWIRLILTYCYFPFVK